MPERRGRKMRITPTMMMNDYQNYLDDSLNRLNDDSQKISSGRTFDRGSQDPAGAMQALQASRQLAVVTQYQQSNTEATSWINNSASAIQTVNSLLQSANSTILEAQNGTNDANDETDYSASIDSYQQELLETLNSTFSGQYVFGGTSTGNSPFKVGTADDLASGSLNDLDTSTPTTFAANQVVGKLLYNIPNTGKYIPVSAINNIPASTVALSASDPGYNAYSAYSINNPAMKYTMPIDMGLGMKTDSSGNVVTGTAFDASNSALDFLCQFSAGTSSGNPPAPSDNIYDTFAETSAQLSSGDTSGLDNALDLVQNTQDSELKSSVMLGEKSKMLTFLGNNLTSENTNVTTSLSNIEDTDITQASTTYSMDQMAYQASLEISSTVLQHSLIDFLK